MNTSSLNGFAFALLFMPVLADRAQVPAAIAASGEALVATVHAEGAQIYECIANVGAKSHLAVPRTDCNAAHGWQDGRPTLCRSELGVGRWQRGHRRSVRSQHPV